MISGKKRRTKSEKVRFKTEAKTQTQVGGDGGADACGEDNGRDDPAYAPPTVGKAEDDGNFVLAKLG